MVEEVEVGRAADVGVLVDGELKALTATAV